MSKFVGIFSAIALFVAGSNGHAAVKPNCTPAEKNGKPFFEQGMALKDEKVENNALYPDAYSAPARIRVSNSWDITANVSFIYWNMAQDAMDIAYIPPAAPAGGAVAYQSAGYNPGFQLGLGKDFGHDGWSANADFTWYHNSTTLSGAPAPIGSTWIPSSFSAFVDVDLVPDSVAGEWSLDVNQLDIVTGRSFYHGRFVTISPALGFRALWIEQTEDVTLSTTGAPDDFYTGYSDSWALGVVSKMNARLFFSKGFRVDGIVGTSLLYTRYTTISNESNLLGATVTSSLSNFSALRPTFDAGLGVGYGAYCMDNRYYFDLALRYDFNVFWSQNVMRSYASQLVGVNDTIGNLYLHGLTVNARCDF